jgi:hypothetical protein
MEDFMKGIISKALSLALLISVVPVLPVEPSRLAQAKDAVVSGCKSAAGYVADKTAAGFSYVKPGLQYMADKMVSGYNNYAVPAGVSVAQAVKAHPYITAATVATPVIGFAGYKFYKNRKNVVISPLRQDEVTLNAMLQLLAKEDYAQLAKLAKRLSSEQIKSLFVPKTNGDRVTALSYLNEAIAAKSKTGVDASLKNLIKRLGDEIKKADAKQAEDAKKAAEAQVKPVADVKQAAEAKPATEVKPGFFARMWSSVKNHKKAILGTAGTVATFAGIYAGLKYKGLVK